MIDAVCDPIPRDAVEALLRQALVRADNTRAGVAPILAHFLAEKPGALFPQSVIARIRAMLTDLARQLVQAAQGDPLAPVEEGLPGRLSASLGDCPSLIRHLHAVALEWHASEVLATRLGLDPVLPPLIQALIASDEAEMAATAMHLLAAQARFGQQARRMQIAVGELPGDVLHDVLLVLRVHLAVLAEEGGGNEALAETIAAQAEAHIRASYDESATRLGLCARIITGLGNGALAALDLPHAGLALFISALAISSAQTRDICVLATQEGQTTRLILGLRACGLKNESVAAALDVLQPGAALPADFATITADRAVAILARVGERPPLRSGLG